MLDDLKWGQEQGEGVIFRYHKIHNHLTTVKKKQGMLAGKTRNWGCGRSCCVGCVANNTNLAGAPSVCLPGQPTPIDWLAITLIAPPQEKPQNANHLILATGASPNMLGLKHSFSRQIRGFFQPATPGPHVLLFSSADKPSVRMFDNCCAANR